MARITFRNKVALILGADLPVGRSAALQLSRSGAKTVLTGFDKQRLHQLQELILAKGGEPTEILLTDSIEDDMTGVREVRDTLGHIHFVVNALGAGTALRGGRAGELSRSYGEAVFQLTAGRGAARYLTVWPDECGDALAPPEESWHCLVTAAAMQSQADGEEGDETLKAAAIGDTVVYLLSCPPSACPALVRLKPVNLKA